MNRYQHLHHEYVELHPLPGSDFQNTSRTCLCGCTFPIPDALHEGVVLCPQCSRSIRYTPSENRKRGRPQFAGKPISEDGTHIDPYWHPKKQPVGYKSRLLELQNAFSNQPTATSTRSEPSGPTHSFAHKSNPGA